jgi:hypothetical protein
MTGIIVVFFNFKYKALQAKAAEYATMALKMSETDRIFPSTVRILPE